jgi:phosphate transport system permease protein
MTTTAPPPTTEPPEHGTSYGSLLADRSTSRRGDAVFAGGVRAASLVVVVLVLLTGAFLVWKAVPSLMDNSANFLTDRVWQPATSPPAFGIAALLFSRCRWPSVWRCSSPSTRRGGSPSRSAT